MTAPMAFGTCRNRLCGVRQPAFIFDRAGLCIPCARAAREGTLVTADPAAPKGPLFPSYAAATEPPITAQRCRWCGEAVRSGLLVFAAEGCYHAHARCQLRCVGLDECPTCRGPMPDDGRLPWCPTCDREPELAIRAADFAARTGAPGEGALGPSCGSGLTNARHP